MTWKNMGEGGLEFKKRIDLCFFVKHSIIKMLLTMKSVRRNIWNHLKRKRQSPWNDMKENPTFSHPSLP